MSYAMDQRGARRHVGKSSNTREAKPVSGSADSRTCTSNRGQKVPTYVFHLGRVSPGGMVCLRKCKVSTLQWQLVRDIDVYDLVTKR